MDVKHTVPDSAVSQAVEALRTFGSKMSFSDFGSSTFGLALLCGEMFQAAAATDASSHTKQMSGAAGGAAGWKELSAGTQISCTAN